MRKSRTKNVYGSKKNKFNKSKKLTQNNNEKRNLILMSLLPFL